MGNKKISHYIERVPVEKIIPLRHQILRSGLPIEKASFSGDEDDTTYHFAVFAQGYANEPVCCVSYMLVPHLDRVAYQLRGMATLEELRGYGLGQHLTEHAEQVILGETGIRNFWCNARKSAVGFYEKQNWIVASDEFEIETAGPHFVMTKKY